MYMKKRSLARRILNPGKRFPRIQWIEIRVKFEVGPDASKLVRLPCSIHYNDRHSPSQRTKTKFSSGTNHIKQQQSPRETEYMQSQCAVGHVERNIKNRICHDVPFPNCTHIPLCISPAHTHGTAVTGSLAGCSSRG
jgi:hypothetical protein